MRLRSAITRSLWPIAYHEAGHAVANCVQGIKFRSVYIRSSGEGRVEGSGRWLRMGRYELENRIVATMAGPYAEARFTRQSKVLTLLGQPDKEQAEQAIRMLVDAGFIPDMHDAWQRFDEYTTSLLRKHWPAIERVAGALVQHLELAPGNVAALIGQVEDEL